MSHPQILWFIRDNLDLSVSGTRQPARSFLGMNHQKKSRSRTPSKDGMPCQCVDASEHNHANRFWTSQEEVYLRPINRLQSAAWGTCLSLIRAEKPFLDFPCEEQPAHLSQTLALEQSWKNISLDNCGWGTVCRLTEDWPPVGSGRVTFKGVLSCVLVGESLSPIKMTSPWCGTCETVQELAQAQKTSFSSFFPMVVNLIFSCHKFFN